ncbi:MULTISPECIES: acyl-CoA dehydrogenase family protein [unclassified Acidovorax]|jgi:acyl-CoA dehydrogenase|uniref:acyl-CoA dehydrogenase family protein n=1 Tax=unclassified Acidovorax TaxID=2684926 RepID=UPI000BD4A647|nr:MULTISPECIES: acyl-CoA dehydrogenase family protein [unclassified Acidovorax]OZA57736.1 MAG: acyl-CoA dehydrogenase [Acidovorax sp. 17-64-282]HQS19819.1 acyl-CoA dehydrogenase family protein [Acidovorax defluvii]OYY29962.1 MAG: acyl-CoA dehydrogenase [Acidovorax sp. 35-64-16]OYY86737.1 MAG: acyl-CoA dehydrogenase [Acidovorax sp. 28-64-14]OYZ47070.1 MAG: acyl-CoA dehydrogenase [Acidovorax sp. 16-64-162]
MLPNHFISADEQAELQLFTESLERFCDAEIEPHYRTWEKAGRVPRELLRKMGENGYLCADVPDTYGGPGASVPFSFAVVEVLSRRGYGGFVGGLQVHNDIIPPYLLHCGTEAQRAHWLPRMASGEAIAAIGMTEPGAGSDLKAIRTTARKDGDHYVINGSKIFISNGQNCDLLVLAAKTDPALGAKGVSLFLVDAATPGFTRGQNLEKIGQHAGDTSELFFNDMRVPQDALLGGVEGQGFVQMMRELPRERLIIGVQAVHGAKGALDATLKYVQERQAFGQAIGQFQNTRFTLAQCATDIAAAEAFLNASVAAYQQGQLTPEAVSALKLHTTELFSRVADACLQLFGGYGYMAEYPISRFWTDARVLRIYGGTSEIMKELVARSLLGR